MFASDATPNPEGVQEISEGDLLTVLEALSLNPGPGLVFSECVKQSSKEDRSLGRGDWGHSGGTHAQEVAEGPGGVAGGGCLLWHCLDGHPHRCVPGGSRKSFLSAIERPRSLGVESLRLDNPVWSVVVAAANIVGLQLFGALL